MASKKLYAQYQPFVTGESIYELRRARARAGNAANSSEFSRLLEENGSIDVVYKTMLLSLLTVDDRDDPHNDKIETRDVIEENVRDKEQFDRRITEKNKVRCVRKEFQVVKEGTTEKVRDQICLQQLDKGKKAIVEDDRLVQSRREHVAHVQPVKKYTEQRGGKFKGMVKEEYDTNKKTMVEKENEKICRDPGSRTRVSQVQLGRKRTIRSQTELMEGVQGDDGLPSKKTAFGDCAVNNKEPYYYVKCTECSIPFKKYDGKYFKGESSSRTVPAEVEILDNERVVKKGMFGHFVPSTQFHSSMMDEEPEEYGLPIASEDFRTEVLKVLRKPYNKEEYHKCREKIRDGSYAYLHPDLQRKLTRFRYKRDKCLIVLRGFLFWLQNSSREGAFEPWKDRECLAVQLPSC
ncbi:hypothetical protein C2S51_019120 [Perilla frutescens var. frutescens]|nr:hypothetical protein C2S51_019120 [Perilla frutescens var. frutescens]